ncbi:MAG: hypothetical protein M3R60_11715 [Pseudomonadota bacterium]|nr:hypothetical protein [Pseudomonadota bacterium]
MLFRGAPLARGEIANYAGWMEAGPSQFEEFAAEARERFARIETRLDQTATKADLLAAVGDLRSEMDKGFLSMVKWIVGTALGISAAAITVMTFVLNYATPPRNPPVPIIQPAPAPAVPPVIIQLPPYPAPPR